MPRYGRFDAIYFFETSGGVLRGSRCVRHVPELEKYEAGYENFDRKSRFSLGNLKNIGRRHSSGAENRTINVHIQ